MFIRGLPLILVGYSLIAGANESFMVWHSGSLCATSMNDDIAMKSEEVSITFGANEYTVDGTFVFYNSGKDTHITMGFPMAYGGVLFNGELLQELGIPEKPETWVSGEEVPFEPVSENLEYYGPEGRKVLKGKTEIDLFQNQMKLPEYSKTVSNLWGVAWYSKDVFFKQNETVVTRVKYKSRYGKNSFEEILSAGYIYGSGKTWKGNIEKAAFRIHTSPDMWMLTYPRVAYPHRWTRAGEYEYVLTLENFEPADMDSLQFDLSRTLVPYLLEGCFETETNSELIETLTLCNEKQMDSFKAESRIHLKDRGIPFADEDPVRDESAPYKQNYGTWGDRFRLVEHFREYNKKMKYKYEINAADIALEIN
jgi:hypothetical protein